MPTAYGYLRVSHPDSKATGISPEIQEQQIRAYFALLQTRLPDLVWGELFQDLAVSSWKIRLIARAGGGLLNEALQPGDHVIFARLDRVFRQLEDQLKTLRLWDQRGVTSHFAHEQIDRSTPHGSLIFSILGSVNQHQSEVLSLRMKEVAAKLKAEGRPGSGPRKLGFNVVGPKGNRRYVPNTVERRLMQEVYRLRVEEKLDYWSISDHLEAARAALTGATIRARWLRGPVPEQQRIAALFKAEKQLREAEAAAKARKESNGQEGH